MTPRSNQMRCAIRGVLIAIAMWTAAGFAAVPPFRLPTPTVRTLENGLRVAVFPDHRRPIVQMELLIPAGSAADPGDAAGIAALTAELLRMGTSSRNADAYASDVDSLGGAIVTGVTRDYASVTGAFLARDFESGLELMSDAVLNPLFPEVEVRRALLRSRGTALQRRLNPASAADDRIWKALFEGHPYGHPTSGVTEGSIGITGESILAFHHAHYVPDGAVLAVAGDVDPEKAMDLVAEWFGGWTGKAAAAPASAMPPARARILIVDRPDMPATELEMGIPAPARGAADELPVAIASQMLGGAQGSRLSRLADDGWFASEPRSRAIALRQGGLFAFGALVPSDSTGVAVERMREELRRFLDGGPAASELASAKRYARNVYPMQLQTLAALLEYWTPAVQSGLPVDFDTDYTERVDHLSVAGVQEAARRWLDPARLTIVAAGPSAVLEPLLRPFGPVEIIRPGGPPPAPVEPPPAFTATREEEAKGRELVKRAVAAHGGLPRLQRIKDSLVEAEATLQVEGREIRGHLRQIRKDPWRMFYSTSFGGFDTDQTLNGNDAWSVTAQTKAAPQPMDSLGVAGMRAGFSSDVLHVLLGASTPEVQVASRGRETVQGIPADRVDVRHPDGQFRRLYFDVSTHRLVAIDQREGGGSGFSTRRLYSDYKAVQGVQWPHTEERFLNGDPVMEIKVTRVLFDNGVDDSIFEKPEPELARPSR